MNKESYPTLYGKSRKGKIKEWSISVTEQDGLSLINTLHGFSDGKKQLDSIEVTVGKNIGKANETTPFEQAISVAKSKWNSKISKGYSEDVNNIPVDRLPMLAKRYKDSGKHIKFPCFVQPKLNGVRCFMKKTSKGMESTSREGNAFETVKHIEKELKAYMKVDEIFDGELYKKGEAFQDISSAVKNVKHKEDALLDCNKLEYWVYDIADKFTDFKDRSKKLEGLKGNNFKNIVIVSTYIVNNENELNEYHKQFTQSGYEGTIIRNIIGGYEFDHRSDNLQKKKDFLDAEFKIVGVKCGEGRYKNCATFICEVNGKTFDVNPKGTIAKKEQYWADGNKNIGKMLTVKYQEKSKGGVPIFPVGLAIRDYE